MRSARWWHLATFVVGLFGLLLQLWISATHSVAYDGHVFGTPTRIANYLSYFTIWSNILVIVVAWLLFRSPARSGPTFSTFRLASLVMITVTGLVYAIILAPIWNPTGWDRVADRTLHYATPVLCVLTYLLAGPRPRFNNRMVGQMVAIPLVWVAYTLVRSPFVTYSKDGRTRRWWPYHFINLDDLGAGRVLGNVVGVAVILILVGYLYLLLDRKLPRAGAEPRRSAPRPRRSRSDTSGTPGVGGPSAIRD